MTGDETRLDLDTMLLTNLRFGRQHCDISKAKNAEFYVGVAKLVISRIFIFYDLLYKND